MIHSDNSAAIKRHELEDLQQKNIFRPPETLSNFLDMSYKERLFLYERNPSLYYDFLRMECAKK